MLRAAIICFWIWLLLPTQQARYADQWERPSTILFENRDFWVARLSDLRDPKLQNQSFSGFLFIRGDTGKIDYGSDVWKVEGHHPGTDNYYWADSAKTNRLTAMDLAGPGFLVVPKSGERVSTKIFSPDLPGPFTESVSDDVILIAKLVDRGQHGLTPSEREQYKASAGLADILLKSRWVSSNWSVPDQSIPLVSVTARTLDHSGTVVQHCTVWYVPIAWEDDKEHWKRFDEFSSPTTQLLAVGQYKMWANHNGDDGTKVAVNPGDDLKPTKKVDLDVP